MERTAVSPSSWLPELQRLLLISRDLEDLLQQVPRLSAAVMPADSSCVIAVEPPGRPLIVAASDETALAVATTDWTHREGPHLEVTNTGRAIYSPDIARRGRSSAFVIEARARNIRCALSNPIQGPDGVMGVLSSYSTRPHVYDDITQHMAQAFADTVAVVVTIMLKLADQTQVNEDLNNALMSRSIIDQAIGVIMAENRCAREDAFNILRNASQNRHEKLREIAADLVRSITGHEPTPGPFSPRQ
jgi:GAF domain-containing protein